VLAGIDGMDAGLFAEGSWAAAAERTVLQAGLDAAGVNVRVLSPGASFSEQGLWDTFLASLPAGCNAAGTAFGDFGALPKECRPKGKLTFSMSKKSPPPHSVNTTGMLGNCGFKQEDRACYGTTFFQSSEGGGFVFGTTSYFELRVAGVEPLGDGGWPAATATPATIGEVLGGDPVVRQVARHAEGDAIEALGLPNTSGLTEVGVTGEVGGETATKIRRRTKGGFVVDITGIEEPSGGGTSTGTWLGGYEVP
jgi:hypothetical protein